MSVPLLRHEDSLDSVRDDLIYTEARLVADKRLKDLAPAVAKLIARAEKAAQSQRDAWRAETVAQALVDKCDDDLDDQVGLLAVDLTHAEGGKKNGPRYKRYFTGNVTDVIRLGLASEIQKITGWAKSLTGEKESALKSHGKALQTLVTSGDSALETQASARSARADHRLKEIYPLIDDANAARLSIAGEIDKRAAKLRLASHFSSRFFRHATRAPKVAHPAEPAAAPAPATHAGSQAL